MYTATAHAPAAQPKNHHLADKFREFDRKNPEVYALFYRFTMEAVASGRRHFSAKAVYERIRWETSVITTTKAFKLLNAWTAYYARKFMQENPAHDGFFRTAELRSERG